MGSRPLAVVQVTPHTSHLTPHTSHSMNISNLQYSVRDIISQDNKVPPPHSQKKQEEAVHCWIVNLVKEEALEEKVAVLSKRCMTRFLESLEPESLSAWRSSQLLAAACLLVTSKIVSSRPLGGRKLLKYSGGAFSMEELMSCELLLLSKLGWDVYLDCQQEEHVTMLDNLTFSN